MLNVAEYLPNVVTFEIVLQKSEFVYDIAPLIIFLVKNLVATCFCQDCLNWFKLQFKLLMAETCQPCSHRPTTSWDSPQAIQHQPMVGV